MHNISNIFENKYSLGLKYSKKSPENKRFCLIKQTIPVLMH